MKQFAVIGLGDFGMQVAVSLAKAGHQVLAIDLNKKKVEDIKDRVTYSAIADVRDKKVMADLISPDLDGVIISLGRLEENVLATLYVKERGVKNIYVKPLNEDHGIALRAIGATELIYPDKEMAENLALKLSNPNFMEHLNLAEGYSVLEVAVPEKFYGKSLGEVKIREHFNVLVIAVNDALQGEMSFIPGADFRLGADSSVLVIGKDEDIQKFRSFQG